MAELIDIVVPEGQQEGTESTLMQWLKQAGDTVALHEPLIELETDKVIVEIASPASGVLHELLVEEQNLVEPGAVLGRIAAGAMTAAKTGEVEKPAKSIATAKSAATADQPKLSPAVRKLLEKHGLDASMITGSGRDGRVTREDVEKHVAGGAPLAEETIVPHTMMRKRIAAHMVKSVQTAPHVTCVFQADMSAVAAHRSKNRAGLEDQGVKLTYTAYFVKAAVEALRAVPEVNSRFHDEGLELFTDINIGIGTALGDEGLIVPVIHGAQEMPLDAIAGKLQTLTEKARKGELGQDDVSGGTFTISNHGVSGSLMASPIIINQPQCAILGIGKLEKRVVVVESDGRDEMEIRLLCYVTLTIDHRALDAHQTNKFLSVFVATLEGWPD
ncbi:MAG: 2-oxo acid dehydrogenase subunit E2 [Gammaproteobacteria bacterium]|nr:2-oxo acid dehydrogenase subunit E2 [Gammaproteobacteria bacterium]MCZ6716113.1 2-oxo acid dehydrogenase subunit E2 [Gammaproteobacteria bacterium]